MRVFFGGYIRLFDRWEGGGVDAQKPANRRDLVAYSVALEVVGQILGLVVGYIALQNERYTLVYYFVIPAVITRLYRRYWENCRKKK